MTDRRQKPPASEGFPLQTAGRWTRSALCVVFASLAGCGGDRLRERDEQVQQAWHLVDQYYSARVAAGARALAAAGKSPGFDRSAYAAADAAIRHAAALPHDAALANNPRVFDQYKQAQGELTGALFRLLTAARSDSTVASHPSFRALENTLTQEVTQLQDARDRYRVQIAEYNALLETYPTRIAAVALGYKPKQDFVRRPD